MALVNYATREISAKIVYYGPGLSGKTTNIHHVFSKVQPKNKGKLIALSTQGDRTLFFDFLPVELGNIKGFRTRFHLYTVPGQVFYNSTRKLVLKGADGVVFVADSQKMMMDENLQSMENLKTNLADMGITLDNFPVVIQYNKRDLPNAAPVEEIDRYLNPMSRPYFEASAITGEGVLKTLTAIVKFILHDLKEAPSGHNVDFETMEKEDTPVMPFIPEEAPVETVAGTRPVVTAVFDKTPTGRDHEMPRIVLTPNKVSILSPETGPASMPAPAEEAAIPPPVDEPMMSALAEEMLRTEEELPAEFHEDEPVTEPFEEAVPFVVPVAIEETPAFEDEAPAAVDETPDVTETLTMPKFEPEPEISETPEPPVEEALPEPEVALFDEAGPEPEHAGAGPEENFWPGGRPSVDRFETAGITEKEKEIFEGLAGVGTKQTFMLPVRISTPGGLKEVTLKVSVDIEIAGEGAHSIDKVEVLQPAPPDVSKLKPPEPARIERPERPKQAPVSISKPKMQEKKLSMFQKILGMK